MSGFGPDGIHDADRAWLEEQMKMPGLIDDGDGVCFATFDDETMGPFARKADAQAAQQRRLDALEAQGVDLATAGIRMTIIFGDPVVYHLPHAESQNA